MQIRLARLPFVLLTVLALQTSALGESVTFSKRPSEVGDVSRQAIDCNLEADLIISQGGQLVESSRQGLQRKQDREFTVLELQQGRPGRARMTYHCSSQVSTRQGEEPNVRDEPVSGNSYIVTRTGQELQITDVDGHVPSAEEMAILQSNLQAFGLPNPLADFFDGKTVVVGQTVSLPHHLARELLGFTGTVGEIKRFSLKFVRVERVGGARCAIFETLVQTTSQDKGHMTLLMKGRLILEIDTCRTVGISMKGPVVVSETHGPAQAQFTVSTQGEMNVAVRATYARR